VADFLRRVKTEEETEEFIAAFLQLYREESQYWERTAVWIERIDLAYLKEKLTEDERRRKELASRFHFAMEYL